MHGQHASREARYVFAYLVRRGGSMRLAPMLRHLRIEPDVFVPAVTELAERYWITIVWRKAAAAPPDDTPRPLTDLHRLVATRFGRRKYRSTWPVD